DEMVKIAIVTQPQMVMLVPEGRQEVTTEGGLDVAGGRQRLKDVVGRLSDAGLFVSAFVDPEPVQLEAAAACGFAVCEVHTGPYAHAFWSGGRDSQSPAVLAELEKIRAAGT